MNDFGSKIYDAAKKAVKEVYDLEPAEGQLIIETPQDTKLGDYSTSIAMKLSRTLRRNPMEIAEPLTAKLAELLPECESITVARPGFINFKLKQSALTAVINEVIAAGDDYGKNDSGKDKHMLLEWVSANPTGDLHCGHARNAAWGDCICRLMEASGWDVLREFYQYHPVLVTGCMRFICKLPSMNTALGSTARLFIALFSMCSNISVGSSEGNLLQNA